MSKNIGRRKFMQTAGVVAVTGLVSKTVYANNDDILKDQFGIESAKKLGLRVAEAALRCHSDN